MRQPIRTHTPLWQRVARGVLSVTAATAIGLLVAVLLLEWMAGCGETYTDSKGVQHVNECLFINR
jgi:hypothetical protein